MLDDKKALVILSGGQDSTTVLFYAVSQYGADNVQAICFNYGQTHAIEIDAAKKVASIAKVELEIVDIPNVLISTSPLLDKKAALDKYDNYEKMEEQVGNQIEKTFVPMRNTFFLTIAANRAVAKGIANLYTGICQMDNANYPDCTNKFVSELEQAFNESLGFINPELNVCTEEEFQWLTIHSPLMYRTKAQTVELAYLMPECWYALQFTHTSYDGKYPPVDNNHSNILRAKGFEEANLPDPLVVRAWREGLMELPATRNYNNLDI